MAKTKYVISEKDLTKGEIRKLNALRKSLGEDIANRAFAEWYEQQAQEAEAADPNIEIIEKALQPHLKKMRFPRSGGYTLRRGKGRVIVEPIE